uniref:Putative tick transposon n=1 Tax=Ixodes ricinus TaxID=34613 RepID=A0A147BPK5_IXORI
MHLRKTFTSFIHLISFICGTTWGAKATSVLRLYKALFEGLLRYSLPVFHGMCATNLKQLQSIQGSPLRACLGVPHSTSTLGVIAEAGPIH